jgi:uridylate kinase
MLRYKRVLIKLSGGAIAGEQQFGFDPASVDFIVREVLSARDLGVEIVIVVGGGNIFRGRISEEWSIDRVEADSMGMLGTVINAVMLRAALKSRSTYETRVMTATSMEWVAEPYIRLRALKHLEKGYIIVMAGGIGNPYVTTDYPAVQRALETRCEAILVAKHGVDGVYTGDPRRDSSAVRYASMDYEEVIRRDLKVMDQPALMLAKEHNMPMHVFDFDRSGSILSIVTGESVGTYLGNGVPVTLATS